MGVEESALSPLQRFVSFRGGRLDGEVINAEPGPSSVPGAVDAGWVERAVHAARLDDEALEYWWTGQTFTPTPGRQIIIMAPRDTDRPTF